MNSDFPARGAVVVEPTEDSIDDVSNTTTQYKDVPDRPSKPTPELISEERRMARPIPQASRPRRSMLRARYSDSNATDSAKQSWRIDQDQKDSAHEDIVYLPSRSQPWREYVGYPSPPATLHPSSELFQPPIARGNLEHSDILGYPTSPASKYPNSSIDPSSADNPATGFEMKITAPAPPYRYQRRTEKRTNETHFSRTPLRHSSSPARTAAVPHPVVLPNNPRTKFSRFLSLHTYLPRCTTTESDIESISAAATYGGSEPPDGRNNIRSPPSISLNEAGSTVHIPRGRRSRNPFLSGYNAPVSLRTRDLQRKRQSNKPITFGGMRPPAHREQEQPLYKRFLGGFFGARKYSFKRNANTFRDGRRYLNDADNVDYCKKTSGAI